MEAIQNINIASLLDTLVSLATAFVLGGLAVKHQLQVMNWSRRHVGNALLLGLVAGELQLGLVDVGADGLTLGRDPAGQFQSYISAAAANIETGEPVIQTEPVEQGCRARAHDTGQDAEVLFAHDASGQHIVCVHFRRCPQNARSQTTNNAEPATAQTPACGA